ncbi:hypothetical protein BST61_g11313 [Cercospora zeina]
MPPDDDHPQRKRRRSLSTCDDIEEQPSDNYPPEFWDALSKITLTRRALKELDRRTAVEKTAPEVAVGKRSTRLLRSDTKKLLRFAQNGGPSLNHLRGYSAHLRPAADMSKSSSRKGKRTRDSGLPSSDSTKTSGTTEKFALGLKVAQPDKYYGARPEQVDERIRRDLGQQERWGPAGRSAATGTGTLQMYSTHPRQSTTGDTEYHMTQLDTYGMTGNIETFRRGAAAYRNARDFAQEQRDRLITQANFVARSASTDVSSGKTDSMTGVSFAPLMANNSFGSDTSADELALHHSPSSDESDGKAHRLLIGTA